MPHSTPAKRREYAKTYYAKNKVRLRERGRTYYLAHKGHLDEYRRKWRADHREEQLADHAERQRGVKRSVRHFLGGKCRCCGESEFEFLTIDHVNNDGAQDKKRGIQSSHIYWRVWKMMKSFVSQGEVEKTYRLLCFNCNSSKHFGNGTCVHERKRMAADSFGRIK